MKKQHYRKCYQQLLTTLLITFLLALFSIVETAPLYASNLNIFALTKEKGILISYDNGDDWEKFNKGLPAGIIPIRIYSAKGTLYLTTTSSGIFRLSKNKTWANISSPDFRVRSQYNKTTQYRKISAFSFDRNNPSNIVLATKHTIYRSTNSGKNWRKIPAKGLHKRNYITALAINKKNIYAGTSFNGFFKLNYGRFKKINKGLPAEP
ncbi:MAG: hypothetical protein GY754_30305, partial [bacterium]|nr:hypothetical protein [bacterium]